MCMWSKNYRYWQYFFHEILVLVLAILSEKQVLVMVLPILSKSIVNNPGARTPRFCPRSVVIYLIYRWSSRCYREARCDVTRVYTDDTQLLYLQCHRDNTASSALHLECCLLEINHWQSSTKQLNLPVNVIGPAFLSFIFRSCISSAMSSPVAGGVVAMARARCCSCLLQLELTLCSIQSSK